MRDRFGNLTIEITRDQLHAWAGGPLTDEQVERLDEIVQFSSIPDAIGTIVTEAMGVTWDEDESV